MKIVNKFGQGDASAFHMPDPAFEDSPEAIQRYREHLVQPHTRYTEQLPHQFIPLRLPDSVFYNGASLEFHLERHHAYLAKDPDGRVGRILNADLARVYFRGWDLSGIDFAYSDFVLADLTDVCLEGCNLDGVRGNGVEIKSAVFDEWPVVWTECPDYGPYIQIGCQRHHFEKWEKSDPRWIRHLSPDEDRNEAFWARNRETVLGLVSMSPAKPWSHAKETYGNYYLREGS